MDIRLINQKHTELCVHGDSVQDAVARIVEHDQWIWDQTPHDLSRLEHATFNAAIRQAIQHFASLFEALAGPQELANITRAKVLIGAMMHSIANNADLLLMPGINKLKSRSRSFGTNTTSPKDNQMRSLTAKLSRSLYALCLTPRSVSCQNRFLYQHIRLTLTLLRRGISPVSLAIDWTKNLEKDFCEASTSSESAGLNTNDESSMPGDAVANSGPLTSRKSCAVESSVANPPAVHAAVSLIMFALEIRKAFNGV